MPHDLGSRDRRFIAIATAGCANGCWRSSTWRRGFCLQCHCKAAARLCGRGKDRQLLLPRDGQALSIPRQRRLRQTHAAHLQEYYGRAHTDETFSEDQPCDPAVLDRRLAADPDITHGAVAHCETTSGVLNPIEDIAYVVARHGRRLLIDAMKRVRRAAARRRENAIPDAVVALQQQMPGSRARHGFLHRPPRRDRRRPQQRPLAQLSTCTTSGTRWRRTARW